MVNQSMVNRMINTSLLCLGHLIWIDNEFLSGESCYSHVVSGYRRKDEKKWEKKKTGGTAALFFSLKFP